MSYAPTYRYGLVISGANYAPGDVSEPTHVAMCENQAEVRQTLLRMKENYARSITETGAGTHTLDTPGYGYPGDYADVYRVDRDHKDFSEVLDEPGDRARHAYMWLAEEPAYRLTFGPRGGLKKENF